MTVFIDHTIVPVRDEDEAVEFYTRIFGFEDAGRSGEEGRFAVVRVNDITTLDFSQREIGIPRHFAFVMEPDEFEGAFHRIKEAGIPFGDGPKDYANMRGPGVSFGSKGPTKSVYFHDPNKHLLEILTY